MFCNKCGAQLPDGSKYCNKCGATIKGVSQKKAVETPVAVTPEAVATPAAATPETVASSVTPTLQDGLPSEGATTASEETPAKVSRTARIAVVSVAAAVLLICLGIIFYLRFVSVVVIDESRFPDQNFRSFVTAKMDTNNDGVLSHDEVAAVTDIDLTEQTDVNDVTGIVVFTELQTFNLGANTVEEVDLSKNSHVSKVSTGAGSASSIKLPSGFDLEAGLDGAPGAEIQSGNTVVQEGEWTTSNNGWFGALQRYNGTLYTGIYQEFGGRQIKIEGATPFFENTSRFYLANDKAYWIDNDSSGGISGVSLYSANIDGSSKQTIAQDVYAHTGPCYVGGKIVYRSIADRNFSRYVYIDPQTGVRGNLPSNTVYVLGACDNRILLTLGDVGAVDSIKNVLFDLDTNEMTIIDSSTIEKVEAVHVSNEGVLLSDVSSATLVGPDGVPVWENQTILARKQPGISAPVDPFADDKNFYMLYKADQSSQTYRLTVVKQADAESSYIDFDVPRYSGQDETSGRILMGDGEGVIIAFRQSVGSKTSAVDLYYVSLSGGEAKLLQRIT